ncbi:4Fe-4S dicluster domain-containing protein [Uliginosibacterium sediminicola]|uniref:4Fe-4S dicluster domain-containing protein n=1 Tax=Uliginosibacterium sediminicola TaxID=2024550 RepID=A0ABU9YVQ8_9RHOO
MNRFVIAEPAQCIGCNTCMAACSVVHRQAGLQSLPRLTVMRDAGRTAPMLCRQCDDAPCARVCPVAAIKQGKDAIELNETLCIGCKLCAIACPFGAITMGGTPCSGVLPVSNQYISPAMLHTGAPGEASSDSQTTLDSILASSPGVKSVAVKCDLCASRPSGPECLRVCPTHALYLVDHKTLDTHSEAKRELAAAALAAPMGFMDTQEPGA